MYGIWNMVSSRKSPESEHVGEDVQIGERMRVLREHLGKTLRGFSDFLKYPLSTYDNWEKGRTSAPGIALRKIAIRTGCSVHWLVMGEGPMFGTGDANAEAGRGENIPRGEGPGFETKGLREAEGENFPRDVAEAEAAYYRQESPKSGIVAALRSALEAVEASEILDRGEMREIMGRLEQTEEAGEPERLTPPILQVVSSRDLTQAEATAVEDESGQIAVVPILEASIAAGAPLEVDEGGISGWAFCYREHVPHPDCTRCIRIQGESMSPVIPDGALVGVDHAIRDVRQMTHKPHEPPRAAVRVEDDGGCVVRNVRLVGERMLLCEPENKGDFPEFSFDLSDPDLPNPVLGQVIWWYVSAL